MPYSEKGTLHNAAYNGAWLKYSRSASNVGYLQQRFITDYRNMPVMLNQCSISRISLSVLVIKQACFRWVLSMNRQVKTSSTSTPCSLGGRGYHIKRQRETSRETEWTKWLYQISLKAFIGSSDGKSLYFCNLAESNEMYRSRSKRWIRTHRTLSQRYGF